MFLCTLVDIFPKGDATSSSKSIRDRPPVPECNLRGDVIASERAPRDLKWPVRSENRTAFLHRLERRDCTKCSGFRFPRDVFYIESVNHGVGIPLLASNRLIELKWRWKSAHSQNIYLSRFTQDLLDFRKWSGDICGVIDKACNQTQLSCSPLFSQCV
jgi:hypothetical protein